MRASAAPSAERARTAAARVEVSTPSFPASAARAEAASSRARVPTVTRGFELPYAIEVQKKTYPSAFGHPLCETV